MTVASVTPPVDSGRDDVYVAAVPLTAAKGPPQLLMSTAYSLRLSWDFQHFMVLSTSPFLPSQVHFFVNRLNILKSYVNFYLYTMFKSPKFMNY